MPAPETQNTKRPAIIMHIQCNLDLNKVSFYFPGDPLAFEHALEFTRTLMGSLFNAGEYKSLTDFSKDIQIKKSSFIIEIELLRNAKDFLSITKVIRAALGENTYLKNDILNTDDLIASGLKHLAELIVSTTSESHKFLISAHFDKKIDYRYAIFEKYLLSAIAENPNASSQMQKYFHVAEDDVHKALQNKIKYGEHGIVKIQSLFRGNQSRKRTNFFVEHIKDAVAHNHFHESRELMKELQSPAYKRNNR